ncbi:putative transcriptional regulator, TetR family [Nocardia nova SH22a]|uniref:Putative transcriptional regulator, TetR family n=1 Tax=Nocardia nova SH22a TaxID=1415166 RepID=W5TD21_9NOCA|nr:TetR/AcrR family transcriptional regulator C-terminal domain-containing protein [Nocardia nova]AHH15136.1 putative transcriptional regulator, TetR family [Nocardia nova SH22a]
MAARQPSDAQDAAPLASVWTRPHRARREQPALSRDQIVAEAMALLDAEGFDALSMRKLGSRMGAGATSLYTHVANKDELLELVVDEAFGEITLPTDPAPGDWRATMLDLCGDIRRIMLRHPWIPVTMSSAGLVYLGPNMLRLSEAMLEILERAGFDDESADRALNAIFAYTIGTTSTEAAALSSIARSGLDEQRWFEQMMAAAELASRPYPRVYRRYTEYKDRDANRAREDNFEHELGLIMDGLHSRRRA